MTDIQPVKARSEAAYILPWVSSCGTGSNLEVDAYRRMTEQLTRPDGILTATYQPEPLNILRDQLRKVIHQKLQKMGLSSQIVGIDVPPVLRFAPSPTDYGSIAAFAELEARGRDDSDFKDIVQELRSDASIGFREALTARLLDLLEAYKEEQAGTRSLSASSARGLLTFLRAVPYVRYPSVTATDAGDLYVQWKFDSNRLLSIHFLSDGTARFVTFTPNHLHENRVDRTAGTTTWDGLMDKLTSLSALVSAIQ